MAYMKLQVMKFTDMTNIVTEREHDERSSDRR